jgi:hypothetical protein
MVHGYGTLTAQFYANIAVIIYTDIQQVNMCDGYAGTVSDVMTIEISPMRQNRLTPINR